MKIVESDGFEFRFENALEAFVFDEKDSSKPMFHGVPMKGVDVVAEFDDAYVYVELKDFDDPTMYDVLSPATEDEKEKKQAHFKWLKNYLKYKFRDTYLFRYAEGKVDKPVRYICLLNFDNPMSVHMMKQLKRELPVGKASCRWVKALATGCYVVNLDKWNENFPKWQVARLDAAGGA